MLDSIGHRALKIFCNRIFGVKMLRFCYYVRNVANDVIS